MAYVIFTANGDEIDRRELTAALTVGRASDADVPVRDILLSRKHCRLEPTADGGWVAVDLGSKNGTYIGNKQISRHVLGDGDELRIGRTVMTYRAGPFEPAPPGTKRRETVRPADPTEALAGTVAGFILVEPGEVERQPGAPIPQPRPPEPTGYASEDVYGMLNEIASSSWDSIMAQASRPLVMERPLPRPSGYREAAPVARRPRVAFCLQAPVAETHAPVLEELASEAAVALAAPRPPCARSSRRWWRLSAKTRRQVTMGILTMVATALLVSAWIMAIHRGPQPSMGAPPTYKYRRVPRTDQYDLVDITPPSPSPIDQYVVEHAAAKVAPNLTAIPRNVAIDAALRAAAIQFVIVH
jgi:pSer/pThr/pTyr-binding forkhead associated (FHA) protein